MDKNPPRRVRRIPQAKEPKERWRLYIRNGLKSLQAGRHQEAVQHFSQAYKLAPNQPEVCLALGREYARRGQIEEAEVLLRKAVKGEPFLAAAYASLARLLGVYRGQMEEAWAVLEEGKKRCEDRPVFFVVEGDLLLAVGKHEAARKAFEKAQEYGAPMAVVALGIARTYNQEGLQLTEAGRFDEALFAFKRASHLAPMWSAPILNMGVAFIRLGKVQRAISYYEEALRIEPDNSVALFNMAEALRLLGKHDLAIETYERVLQMWPECPGVRQILARLIAEKGLYDWAIELYRQAIEDGAEDAATWEGLGLSLIAKGNEADGERCLRRALEKDPHAWDIHWNLAALLACQGRISEAETLMQQARHLDEHRTDQWLNAAKVPRRRPQFSSKHVNRGNHPWPMKEGIGCRPSTEEKPSWWQDMGKHEHDDPQQPTP